MRKLTILVLGMFIGLTACGQAEWGKERDLGRAAAEAGDVEKAIVHYEKAIELNPDFDNAKRELKALKKEIKKENERKEKEKKSGERQKKVDDWINSFPEGSVEKDIAPIVFEVFGSSYSLPPEIISQLEYIPEEKKISITVLGKDGWSDESIGLGFYEDSTAIYRELAKDNRINSAWLTIKFPMQDNYGNVEDEEVMVTWMSRETMDKINWKSFGYQKLLDVVDGKRIYPQFVQ